MSVGSERIHTKARVAPSATDCVENSTISRQDEKSGPGGGIASRVRFSEPLVAVRDGEIKDSINCAESNLARRRK